MRKIWRFQSFVVNLQHKTALNVKEKKTYPIIEEEDDSCLTAAESVVALAEPVEQVLPDTVDYAHIVDGVLQVTPDIEEEIAEVERGEVVSMAEFKNMFSRWL
jgi:hypothetical protein